MFGEFHHFHRSMNIQHIHTETPLAVRIVSSERKDKQKNTYEHGKYDENFY